MPRAVDGWKACSACKEKKPISEFHQDNSRVDGLQYWCKICRATYDKVYRQSDKGKAVQQAATRRYRQTEGGKAAQQAVDQRYRQTRVGKVVRRAAQQRYSQTEGGKAVDRAAQKRYSQTDAGQAVYSRANRKRRALKAGAISDVTPEDFALLDTRHPVCNYCRRAFVASHPLYKRTLDHIIPLSRGGQHILANLVFAHKRCNSQKGDKLPEEWINRWYEQEEENDALEIAKR